MGILGLKPGNIAYHDDVKYEIVQAVDMKDIVVKDVNTGKQKVVPISQLRSSLDNTSLLPIKQSLKAIEEKNWDRAKKKLEIIRPLLKKTRTKREVIERAKEFKLHPTTLYKWIAPYEATGLLSSLLDSFELRGGPGKHRLDGTADTIIDDVIKQMFLNEDRLSLKSICSEIKKRCRNAKVSVPNRKTVASRIDELAKKKVIEKRYGKRVADQQFGERPGEFPDGKYPLDVIQIDHMKVNIIVVDDEWRLSLGERPWLTIAIDVYSRVIYGFYLSFDHPSFFTVGQCLANGILHKESFLRSVGVEGEWNVWGRPRIVHADNAREFRGEGIKRSLDEYQIGLVWRPVKKPRYGAHIERLCGTLKRAIEELPGTTFANPKDKGDYDSEGKAAMTISELEQWMTTHIIGRYHNEPHSGIGRSPACQYEFGIFGDEYNVGTGLPDMVEDEERLRINFLPFEERTVQNYGISIEGIHYYSDVLRDWIRAEENGKARRFFVHYDPRDMSKIYFYDPNLNEFFEIPYKHLYHPKVTLWEIREAKRQLKKKEIEEYDEDMIFNVIEKLNAIKTKAQEKTKEVRKKNTVKKFHQKKMKDAAANKSKQTLTDNGSAPKDTRAEQDKISSIDALFANVKPFAGTKTLSLKDE